VVTGGVAAYKAAALARLLVKGGAVVKTAMTEAGTRFVTPLTFEAVTGGECRVSMWGRADAEIGHVAWAEWADLVVVAPATADFCAKMAAGMAGDFASAVVLASGAPKIVCPSMNTGMYENPATQTNLAVLALRPGIRVLESPSGQLACGDEGAGRMAEPGDIAFEAARAVCPKPFVGKKALVTSGATVEPWDDVRVLTNRSSGRMGAEIARAAWLMGAEVTLVSGPAAVAPGLPRGASFKHVYVNTCREMLDAVKKLAGEADLLVMNAAPADFRPAETVKGKVRKDSGTEGLPLALNPDILKTVNPLKKSGAVWMGFAAEPLHELWRAIGKLKDKNLDYIAVNDTSGPDDGFGGEMTTLTLVDKGGPVLVTERNSTKFMASWTILTEVAEKSKAASNPRPAPSEP
jgi:phosphopantothenoylcysteine decarboxylase/phosphopantothenate--cysteine ligase